MRVVIDTNIIVSAYLGGTLEIILRAIKAGTFKLVVSEAIVSEYLKVLARPKFRIERDEYDDFAALVVRKAEFVRPLETITAVEADPTDNKFLEAAIAAQVDLVVSGDQHLLGLKEFRSIRILTAREFIDSLASE